MSYEGPHPFPVPSGGTGVATLTGLALGSGTSAFTGVSYVQATTFTPVLQFGGANVGITYSQQYGKYQRVGNCVTFDLSLTLTSKGSSTGIATITGLPVTSANDGANYDFFTTILVITAATATYFFADMGGGSITMSLFFGVATTGGFTQLTNTNFANNTVVRIQGLYFA